MKTTKIITALATSLSLVIAASASAAPVGKRMEPSSSKSTATKSPVEHKVMKHVGPIGKGYGCKH